MRAVLWLFQKASFITTVFVIPKSRLTCQDIGLCFFAKEQNLLMLALVVIFQSVNNSLNLLFK
ncbi:hypothetical protein DP113_30855 [Brasilonema octagenarum UFV-E1]|nr:hypothetical protein DP113_30855 [Brasilonema octagenarum UFV-E1]